MKEGSSDKRSAILAATFDLIAEQGFQGAPMSLVATRAGIGVGTIYRYFASKDELVNALYLEVKQRMMACVVNCHAESYPPYEAFGRVSRAMIAFFLEDPKALSFAEQYLNSPLITAATRAEGLQIAMPTFRLFEDAAEQLKPLPAQLMGELIYGAFVALAKYILSRPESTDGKTVEDGISAIWDMIRR